MGDCCRYRELPQCSGWRAINGDKDLDLVVPMLKKNGFPDSHLTILANEQATKKNIAKAIHTLLANLRAGDIVYFTSRDTGNWLQM